MKSKCYFCPQCNGKACYGQMPGMGCPEGNYNFQLNWSGWKNLKLTGKNQEKLEYLLKTEGSINTAKNILLAPMAGAVENMGFDEEKPYYPRIMTAARKAGARLSIGDGAPDEKLHFAADGVRKAAEKFPGTKAEIFLKPYPNEKLLERMEWTQDIASGFGIDIDSYNIVTMRNKAHLEKKTAALLKEIMDASHKKGLPFIVKGVFTQEDINTVTELKPDVIYISNHGGRVDLPQGSTAEVLVKYGSVIKNCCSEIWVDGGIRTREDVLKAMLLGASVAGIGRPFASALLKNGEAGVSELVKSFN